MDAATEELRAAHDVLAGFYRERLGDLLDDMPVERAVLGLFCELVRGADLGTAVADVGCGTGRLAPFLAAEGLVPRAFDLSTEMVRVAREDHPDVGAAVADVRHLPVRDAALAGAVCWYSLMYLPQPERAGVFRELRRVIAAGGHLVVAYKVGDGRVRRGGTTAGLGIAFDVYWASPDELERDATAAGFTTVFRGVRPEDAFGAPQGYLLVRRP